MSDQPSKSIWSRLINIARWADAPADFVGRVVSLLMLPLIATILFDAITRKFIRKLAIVVENDLHQYLNSPVLQDAEWHLHTIIFLSALGYAHSRNANVRLDVMRSRLGPRGRLWVELLGSVALLAPFVALFCYYSWDFLQNAWASDEGAGMGNGIGNRWFIKSFMFFGPMLLFLSGLAMFIRLFVRLFGPPDEAIGAETEKITDANFSAFN